MTLKIQGQGHAQGQIKWSHLRPEIQSICLFFISWQSDHFWLEYGKFPVWPWKFKVKFETKVKSKGHIWGLKFHRYVCFSFRGNRTIFGRDTLVPYLTLKSEGQGHEENNPNSTLPSYLYDFIVIRNFKLELLSGIAQNLANRHFSTPEWPWKLMDDLEKQ